MIPKITTASPTSQQASSTNTALNVDGIMPSGSSGSYGAPVSKSLAARVAASAPLSTEKLFRTFNQYVRQGKTKKIEEYSEEDQRRGLAYLDKSGFSPLFMGLSSSKSSRDKIIALYKKHPGLLEQVLSYTPDTTSKKTFLDHITDIFGGVYGAGVDLYEEYPHCLPAVLCFDNYRCFYIGVNRQTSYQDTVNLYKIYPDILREALMYIKRDNHYSLLSFIVLRDNYKHILDVYQNLTQKDLWFMMQNSLAPLLKARNKAKEVYNLMEHFLGYQHLYKPEYIRAFSDCLSNVFPSNNHCKALQIISDNLEEIRAISDSMTFKETALRYIPTETLSGIFNECVDALRIEKIKEYTKEGQRRGLAYVDQEGVCTLLVGLRSVGPLSEVQKLEIFQLYDEHPGLLKEVLGYLLETLQQSLSAVELSFIFSQYTALGNIEKIKEYTKEDQRRGLAYIHSNGNCVLHTMLCCLESSKEKIMALYDEHPGLLEEVLGYIPESNLHDAFVDHLMRCETKQYLATKELYQEYPNCLQMVLKSRNYRLFYLGMNRKCYIMIMDLYGMYPDILREALMYMQKKESFWSLETLICRFRKVGDTSIKSCLDFYQNFGVENLKFLLEKSLAVYIKKWGHTSSYFVPAMKDLLENKKDYNSQYLQAFADFFLNVFPGDEDAADFAECVREVIEERNVVS